ncbi:MAG TPA: hypothetical protein DEO65_00260 [Bacillus bacterium]|nr:hypothetical protein [Bacillus sp. (in: firmicutes)]
MSILIPPKNRRDVSLPAGNFNWGLAFQKANCLLFLVTKPMILKWVIEGKFLKVRVDSYKVSTYNTV